MTTVTRYIYGQRMHGDVVSFCMSEAMQAEGFELTWSTPAQPWLVRGTKLKDGVGIATTCYWTDKRGSLPWRNTAIDPSKARYLAVSITVNAVNDSALQLAEQTSDSLLARYRYCKEHPFSIVAETTGCVDDGCC